MRFTLCDSMCKITSLYLLSLIFPSIKQSLHSKLSYEQFTSLRKQYGCFNANHPHILIALHDFFNARNRQPNIFKCFKVVVLEIFNLFPCLCHLVSVLRGQLTPNPVNLIDPSYPLLILLFEFSLYQPLLHIRHRLILFQGLFWHRFTF